MALSEKLLNSLPESSREFLRQFFSNCPSQTAALLFLAEYAAGTPLITTDETCSHVFFLLKGRLQATEEHVGETPYRFTEMVPSPVQVIGDFELFTGVNKRYITLMALEPCLFLVMPADSYLYWIKNDANALFLRIQSLMTETSSQSRHERQYLFLDNRARFLHYLQNEVRKAGNHSCVIRDTREEMATKIGCSIRTLNRVIQSLKKEGAISIDRGKVKLNARQAELLRLLRLEP